MKLGETRVRIRIYGPSGCAYVEALVDTGATLTKIPDSVAKKTGLVPREFVNVELADGSSRERGFTFAEMELDERKMTVPLLIGPDGQEALLGLTALEIFRLKVNPATQILEPSKWIEYAVIS